MVQDGQSPGALDALASTDPAMSRALVMCRRMLDADLPLLILGETGVGKDTLARALHGASRRSGGPYAGINCAAIPASLLASELFGYAPGTFTGGLKSGSPGKLVSANGGTVFLDEIGDMPLDLQAYLLRVLEERCVTPLGSNRPVPLDIRFISATHHDLAKLIARGQFRRDLYYRIQGVEVRLPALRERSDLAEIVGRLVREEMAQAGKPSICPGVMSVFRSYEWPGNLRELRSVIRVTLSMCDEDGHLTVEHLPSPLLEFAHTQCEGVSCRCCA